MKGASCDAELMAAVQRGDERALAALYDRHCDGVLVVARSILRDPMDAEDLVHDVFIEMWNNAQKYDPARASVGSWLRVRARSRALDRLRAKNAASRYEVAAGLQHRRTSVRPGDPSVAADLRPVLEALQQLSQPVRLVVQMTFFEGYTCSEIAEAWDLPLGTIKSRLARGVRQLRSRLGTNPEAT